LRPNSHQFSFFTPQELNKCKTELQYWRSKSPATPVCNSCGQLIIPVPPEDMQALVNQGVKPEDMGLAVPTTGTEPVHPSCLNELDTTGANDLLIHVNADLTTTTQPATTDFDKPLLSPIHVQPITAATVIAALGSPRGGAASAKRRHDQIVDVPSTSSAVGDSAGIGGGSNSPSSSGGGATQNNRSDNSKKIRRVQTKVRQQSNNISNVSGNITKTRSK
jgi:F-box protein 28